MKGKGDRWGETGYGYGGGNRKTEGWRKCKLVEFVAAAKLIFKSDIHHQLFSQVLSIQSLNQSQDMHLKKIINNYYT